MRHFTRAFLLFSLISLCACGDEKSAQPNSAALAVQVTKVIQRNIPQYVEYVGQTEAPVSVEIRARVEGFVQEVAFVEGSNVQEGDLLFVIDPKPYEEKLARAKGKLAETQAGYLRAKSDVERFRPLAKMQAIPQRDFDDAVALEKAAQAQVDAAQAEVNSAELDLGYAKIHSPVNGRIGATSARVGSLVGKGEPTLLATISNTDRMWVSFGISEVEYLKFQKWRQERPQEAKDFKIELLLADGSVHPHPGKVNFADRTIDPKTGTLKVRVEFPNPQGVLRPGQFGRVRILLGEKADVLLVPASAVQEIQGTYAVFVVGTDGKASFSPVKLGLKFDNAWAVEEGLKVGELVIVEGVQTVKDGMTVKPQEVPFPESKPSTGP